MLLKLSLDVYVPPVDALPYRPYSRTCPPVPPPHTKRWVKKKICGTITVFVFFAYVTDHSYTDIHQTEIALPGYPPVISYDPPFISTLPFTDPMMVSQQPYCVTVKVYE
jgi:hypothetical protein